MVTLRRFKHARVALALSMMIMGACGIIYEYTLSVLGNNLMGSSHEQIFVIIGIMLFAMGIGAALQRKVVGNLIDKFLFFELLLGLLGGISTIIIYGSFVWLASYQLVLYSFALAVGGLIGLEIPILIRINTEYHTTLRANLSDVLSMDYIGSLLGALLFAYVLLSNVSLGRIGAALGLVNVTVAFFGLLYFRPLVKRPRLLTLATVGSLAILVFCFTRADQWMAYLEQRCYQDPVVYKETSPYQNLILTERGDTLNFYINGRLQFSSRDEAIYHDHLVHLPMILAKKRDRVLILGGGDGLGLREVLRYHDVSKVTLVDIDPAVTRLATTHPDLIRLNRGSLLDHRVDTLDATGISPGEPISIVEKTKLSRLYLDDQEYTLANVHVVNIDAELFIRGVGEKYDVALLDFPDPDTVDLAKLYSVNFYRQLMARLNPGARISVQSTSPFLAKKAYLCIGQSLREAGFHVIPYHAHVPSFGDWGWYLAWVPGPEPQEIRDEISRLSQIPVKTTHLTPELLRASLAFGRSFHLKDSDEEILPSTTLQPRIVRYYREGWK